MPFVKSSESELGLALLLLLPPVSVFGLDADSPHGTLGVFLYLSEGGGLLEAPIQKVPERYFHYREGVGWSGWRVKRQSPKVDVPL